MAFTQLTRSVISRVASKSSLVPSALAVVVPSGYICSNAHDRNRRIAVCEPQDLDEPPASNESVDRLGQWKINKISLSIEFFLAVSELETSQVQGNQ